MSVCKVGWCIAEAGPSGVCRVHFNVPRFRPEPSELKADQFTKAPCWDDAECNVCEGTGEVDHECDCSQCQEEVDACVACLGTGKTRSCSVCGVQVFNTSLSGFSTTHENTCWPVAIVVPVIQETV